jgi:hypothetical protein
MSNALVPETYRPLDSVRSRTHVRVLIESYAGVLHAPNGVAADLYDISLEGLGFTTQIAMPLADDVYLSFTLPDTDGAPFVFHTQGTVIHSTYIPGRSHYLNGYEFKYLTPTQSRVLVNYIHLLIEKMVCI